MRETNYEFASDNTCGLAPAALEALQRANAGTACSYGKDAVSLRAADRIRELLSADAEVRFAHTGTAANAVALSSLVAPFESVLAHEHAHVIGDESGAPAFFGHGLGMLPLSGCSGKIDPRALKTFLDDSSDLCGQTPAALSITQTTEYGTLYSEDQLGTLVQLAKSRGLRVHVDGARLCNAVAAGFNPTAVSCLGVDTLVLGGAKAGAGSVEAIVFFDRSLSRGIDARLKQVGQSEAKSRLSVAPLLGLLESRAWIGHAVHANAMAARLADGIRQLNRWTIEHAVDSNFVFLRLDAAERQELAAARYVTFRAADRTTRFVCSWATSEQQVTALLATLASIAAPRYTAPT